MTATGVHQQRRRVRVWFGSYAIVDQIAEPALAERFEHAMRKRFASLKVTNEPLQPPKPPAGVEWS
jgi:hypothetical protein